ncbi:alkylhydroperoxidase domain protein [Gluconacetobacter tumulisoli]|uniref:Alkylhydroperoxidase domain protein n=1 Tax=Gluconacetobacter tumulisoli TaxID=1286189 RepID=A0A7W4K9G3_9PROT|nr:alkylhydroperoxidase domain protein [Gluconacetobacter tumulisoli]MBB2202814.1 alkylhydroperoxidase domain protein [Gluconacetobacter tumulisoli]
MSGTQQVRHPESGAEPVEFTFAELDWNPWLDPLPESELTARHLDGLVDPGRAKSPYFMLLARDPDILGARTRSDKDIFYNTAGGLPRRERELAAVAVSRLNGCIYCASVHARFSERQGGNRETLAALLRDGALPADASSSWLLVAEGAERLTATPTEFSAVHVRTLREAGFGDAAIVDLINSAAFFNWANRLMLSLGSPSEKAGPDRSA